MRKTLVLSLAAAAFTAGGAAFAQADRPGISRTEVEERASQVFARLDANGDGKLDAGDRQARHDARRKAAFDRLDADGDGQISFAEFTARDEARRGRFGEFREDREDRTRPRIAARPGSPFLPRGADADGDGAISAEEFASAVLTRFDRADTDGDGTVTPAERRALRFEFRPPRLRGRAG